MIVTGEARSTQRNPCTIAMFFTINLMWITLDSNLSLRRERSANTYVRHGTAQTYHNPIVIEKFRLPSAFLGLLDPEDEGPRTLRYISNYQPNFRAQHPNRSLKFYSTLLCARKIFWAKWPKAFSLFYNILLSFLFHVQNQYCETSPSSNFLPQNYVCFVVTSTENICQFKCHYCAALKCIWCQFLKKYRVIEKDRRDLKPL